MQSKFEKPARLEVVADEFETTFSGHSVSCIRINSQFGDGRWTVVLHGAGNADKARILPLLYELAVRGQNVLAFDFLGQGRSGGDLKHQSLELRYQQALQLISSVCKPDSSLVLVGFSMSGQTVGDLCAHLGSRVATIGLCSPAVYAREAWTTLFGSGFTDQIRQPGSWRSSAALEHFSRYKGRAIVATPVEDSVIPEEITRAIVESLQGARMEHIRYRDAPHQIGVYYSSNPTAMVHFVDNLLK